MRFLHYAPYYIFVVTCPTWSWYKHQVWLATSSVWSCFSSYFIKYQSNAFLQVTKGLPDVAALQHSKAVKLRAEGRLLVFCVVPLVSFQQKILSPWLRSNVGWYGVQRGHHGTAATSQDFLSMPQPPTSPDQEPWTENDTKAVQEALNEPFGRLSWQYIPYRFHPIWPSTTHKIIHIIPFPSRYIVVYIFVALSQHYPYLWSQDLAAETGK